MFLPITFLIFNKKFWAWGLFNHTIITIYVDTVDTGQGSLMHSMLSMFESAKSFEKLRLRAFQPYHHYYICWYCRYRTRISNAFKAIYVDTVDTKHIHMFLPITFLIFNWFWIRKKFWKAETEGFSTIPLLLYHYQLSTIITIYVDTVDTRHKYF